jgi:glycosyltransferase involved in cell wall biosynthesis
MQKPLVSVIMPVYNVAPYAAEALSSILNQSYQELEIIIVDDACTDNTIDIIAGFKDSRIKIIRNEKNSGAAASRNNAIKVATGTFLAIMDADDIALPSRLDRQVAYMQANPQTDVLGTAMQYFGTSRYLNYFPESHDGCKAMLLRNVCFGHSTVMFRRHVFDDGTAYYNPSLRQYSEEYDLWCRLVDRFKFANLNEPLLLYRTFPKSIKSDAEEKRITNSEKIREAFVVNQLGEISAELKQLHNRAAAMANNLTATELQFIDEWFGNILQINANRQSFNQHALQQFLARWFFEICYTNARLTHVTLMKYLASSWKNISKPGTKEWLKFIAKHVVNR